MNNIYLFYFINIENFNIFLENLNYNCKILKFNTRKFNDKFKILIDIKYKQKINIENDIIIYDDVNNYIHNDKSYIISFNNYNDKITFNVIYYITDIFNNDKDTILYKYHNNKYYNIITSNSNIKHIKNDISYFINYKNKINYTDIMLKNNFNNNNNLYNMFVCDIYNYLDINYIYTYNINDDDFFIKIKELYELNLNSKNKEQKIPKILHQICLDKTLLSETKYKLDLFVLNNSDWSYMLWNKENIGMLQLKNESIISNVKDIKIKTDLLKYEILYQYGGVFLDLDIEYDKSFNELLNNEFVIGFEEKTSLLSFTNSFLDINDDVILSSKNNKIIHDILFYMTKFNELNYEDYLKRAGISFIYHHIKYNLLCFNLKNILILPVNYLKKYFDYKNSNNKIATKMFKFDDIKNFNVYNNDFFKKLIDLYTLNIRKKEKIPKIPKIIHQIWLGGKLPNKFKRYCESWLKYNPDWKYILWDDEKVKNFKMINRELFDSIKNLSFKCDLLRYEVLYQYGGIYVDTDFECIKSFNDLIHYEFISGYYFTEFMTNINYNAIDLNSAIVASIPKHKILYNTIYNCTNVNEKNYIEVFQKIGPGFFYRNIEKIINENNKNIVNNMLLTPQNYFYPLSQPDIQNNKIEFNRNDENLYAIHWFSTTWSNLIIK